MSFISSRQIESGSSCLNIVSIVNTPLVCLFEKPREVPTNPHPVSINVLNKRFASVFTFSTSDSILIGFWCYQHILIMHIMFRQPLCVHMKYEVQATGWRKALLNIADTCWAWHRRRLANRFHNRKHCTQRWREIGQASAGRGCVVAYVQSSETQTLTSGLQLCGMKLDFQAAECSEEFGRWSRMNWKANMDAIKSTAARFVLQLCCNLTSPYFLCPLPPPTSVTHCAHPFVRQG